MTSISKNVYIDKSDDIVNEYNNTYHRTMKMKPVDIKVNTYIDSIKDVYDNDPKFKVGDHVRISKYKSVFAKGYTSNWSEEVFLIKKIKIQFHEKYSFINDLNIEEIIGRFYEKKLQKNESKRIKDRKIKKERRKQAVCQMERL